jgi:hypothetical protein
MRTGLQFCDNTLATHSMPNVLMCARQYHGPCPAPEHPLFGLLAMISTSVQHSSMETCRHAHVSAQAARWNQRPRLMTSFAYHYADSGLSGKSYFLFDAWNPVRTFCSKVRLIPR